MKEDNTTPVPPRQLGALSPTDITRIEEAAKKWFQYETDNVRLFAYRDGAEYEHRHMAAKQAELIAENARQAAELDKLRTALKDIEALKGHSNSLIIIRKTYEIVEAALRGE